MLKYNLYDEMKEDFNRLTKEELFEKYGQRKVINFSQETGLEPKYDRKTRYTNGLIPSSDKDIVSMRKSKRAEFNSIPRKDWDKTEIKMREDVINDNSCQVGCLLAQLNILNVDLNKCVYQIEYNKHMIKMIQMAKVDNDYIALIEEERYGKIPKLEGFKSDLINDEMILSYITEYYGINTALKISAILKGARNGN